jgi:hypothetical protein
MPCTVILDGCQKSPPFWLKRDRDRAVEAPGGPKVPVLHIEGFTFPVEVKLGLGGSVASYFRSSAPYQIH